jgi:hypothetical protein
MTLHKILRTHPITKVAEKIVDDKRWVTTFMDNEVKEYIRNNLTWGTDYVFFKPSSIEVFFNHSTVDISENVYLALLLKFA